MNQRFRDIIQSNFCPTINLLEMIIVKANPSVKDFAQNQGLISSLPVLQHIR